MDPKEEIRNLFKNYGYRDYIGESISQLEHALQAAHLAEENGCGREMILASLLHDIGHLVVYQFDNSAALTKIQSHGIQNHEKIGADYLRKLGFGGDIPDLVEGHVYAKRWLARDKSYHDKLSPASQNTLIHQGGLLSDEETKEYMKHPLHQKFTQLRLFDDSAKTIGKVTPDLEHYLSMI